VSRKDRQEKKTAGGGKGCGLDTPTRAWGISGEVDARSPGGRKCKKFPRARI